MKLDRGSLLAALTATSMLAAQVLVHRLVSLKLLNNYAFLVISLTMLGFALSGVVLSRLLVRFEKHPGDWLSACAGLFGATLLGSASLILRAELDFSDAGATRPDFVIVFFETIPYALVFAIPFSFGGLILGALLASRDYATRRVYFFDLLGSATGAFVVLPVIGAVGVERALVATSAMQLVGTLVLLPPRRAWSRGTVLVCGAIVALAGVFTPSFFELRSAGRYTTSPTRGNDRTAKLMVTAWDPLGRSELWSIAGPSPKFPFKSLFGDDPVFRSKFQRVITQNNWTYTFAPHLDVRAEDLTGIERTIYSLSYVASPVEKPRVAVIGVGGGTDIVAALHYGAREVTGVEANGGTLALVTTFDRPYFARWANDPRVRLVHDEGRHFLAASGGGFDVIQLSGVDTFSGTPGAAHVFTENYLYTVEAFELYYSQLTNDGLFNVVRTEWSPPREVLRCTATAVAALRHAGIEQPSRHIAIVGSSDLHLLAVLVKKSPFTDADLARLEAAVKTNPLLRIVAGPRWNDVPDQNVYQYVLSLKTPAEDEFFLATNALNVRPVVDDRPFYFRFSYWSHLFPRDPQLWALVPSMEYSILLLTFAIGVVAVACGWIPLRSRPAGAMRRGRVLRFATYFAALGLGYMAVEMALLQQFGLFLGHPSYALSVVLAALLFSTGIGALLTDRLVPRPSAVRVVGCVLAALVLLELLVMFPRLPALMPESLAVRVLVTLTLIAPVGICLGVFLPSGLERLKSTAPELVPWAWGVNGIFSVLGPVFAIAFSISFGIGTLFVTAVPIYLAASWLLPPSELIRE